MSGGAAEAHDLVDTRARGATAQHVQQLDCGRALAAAAGAAAAKHGNRAASSTTGAADVWKRSDSSSTSPGRIEQSIDELGFGFSSPRRTSGELSTPARYAGS